MAINKTKKINKNNFFTKKAKTKTKKAKTKKAKTKTKTKKRRKRININSKRANIGGALENELPCKADPSSFPKCGKEGCVYLTGEQDNQVLKKQWKNYNEMQGFDLSNEGQEVAAESKNLAPKIISINKKPCDLISKIGSENDAPCIVKRRRKTKRGEKILYEEENRKSWCRNYGVENQCVVDDNMYNKFKSNRYINTPLIDTEKIPRQIVLPDVDSNVDGDVDSDNDEGLGDMHMKTDIDESFTNFKPVYLTDLQMERIKGLTINELIDKMLNSLGEERTMALARYWESERDKIIQEVKQLGYFSNDFNEDNIMIDVENDGLCSWINETLEKKEDITPDKIKQQFGKENILKIVDWGLLNRVNSR